MTDPEVDRLAEDLYEYGKLHQHLVSSDAIVALGNMDLRIPRRAAELWHEDIAPVVVATGGIGRLTPKSWAKPEAVMFAEELLRANVPPSDVLIEDKSTNVPENISLAAKSLRGRKENSRRLVLVALPFAERRILALCHKQFSDIDVQVTSPDISYSQFANEVIDREETINLIVGEMERLEKFPAKGFSVAEAIPKKILIAAGKLIDAGYDKYQVA